MKSKNKQYFALKSSLPYLKFGETPVLSRAKFLEYCEVFLREEELLFLKEMTLSVPETILDDGSVEAEYSQYERALRNAVALMRAKKKGCKGEVFLRENNGKAGDTDMSHILSLLQSAPHPAEREKILDKARWAFLEEKELAHYADLDALCIYCRKLLILEKWMQYKTDTAEKNLDKAVSCVEKSMKKLSN